MVRLLPLFVCLLIAGTPDRVAAQSVREHVLGGRAMSGPAVARRAISTEASAEARGIVQQIIRVIGLPATTFDVRASNDVANAEATTENAGRQRLILYNPIWMNNLRLSTSNWSDWLVLAHEVGHHVAFHIDPSFPNHEAELQADYFAGFILNKLKAPLAEVQLAMAMLSSEEASETHPSKGLRVAKVREGWQAAAADAGINVIPAALSAAQRSRVAPVQREQRVALLIGNTSYERWGVQLKNPKNDVIAVGRQLRQLGFATTVVYDGTSRQIAAAIEAFRAEAADADWAIVYFAGTGIEVNGTNFMIPVDADERRVDTFPQEFSQMRLDTALEAVSKARRLRLVVSDACRVDPTNSVVVNSTPKAAKPQLLKVTEPPRGVLVAYSTAAGQEALDGAGDLSPFAESLVAVLQEPGIELHKVFRRVSAHVEKATNGMQVPTVLGNWPDEDLIVSPR